MKRYNNNNNNNNNNNINNNTLDLVLNDYHRILTL